MLMKRVSITEAKNNFSVLIRGLKSGSSVLITDRGRPVARLAPVSTDESHPDETIARLIREGLVRPRRKPLSKEFLEAEPPRVREGFPVVDALLEERREGR